MSPWSLYLMALLALGGMCYCASRILESKKPTTLQSIGLFLGWLLLVYFVDDYIFTAADMSYKDGYEAGFQEADNSDLVSEYEYKLNDLQYNYDSLLDEYDILSYDYNSIYDEYDFYNSYAVVVSSVAGEKYHRYSCYHVRDFSEFYIFNYNAAQSQGYEPCSECNPPQ